MILRPYQQRSIDALYRWWQTHPGVTEAPLCVLPTGCHAKGTRVVMYDGSTKAVEDVAVGDKLLGPDSKPRTVLRTIRGTEPMYRISPLRGGSPFVVNENHVLSLMTTSEGKPYPSSAKSGQLEAITVKDYLVKSKSWRHLRKLHRSGPVHFAPLPPPIFDPWALGALLGDGSMINGVQFINPDQDILDAMLDVMRRYGLDFSAKNTKARGKNIPCWHVSFVDEEASKSTPNRVTALLRELGVWGCRAESKFVPDPYKRGSIDVRANVLAGLLDTDGHYDGRGGYDFISKSMQLAKDCVFIARSLGITASISECQKSCQTGAVGTYWRVHLSGDASWLPLRCARKRAAPRQQKKNPRVSGFSVEPVGMGDFYGFTLDQDHLYLTDDFTVHHNSGKSVVIAELCRLLFDTWPDEHPRTVVLVPSKELAEQNAAKLIAMLPTHIRVGYYSASLGRKSPHADVIVATIGSVYKAAHVLGNIRCVIIDEAHLVNTSGAEAGRYRQFLTDLARLCKFRVVGYTATPFRGDGVWLTEGDDPLFTGVACTVTVRELLDAGHLAPLVRPVDAMKTRIDTSGIGTYSGDYNIAELSDRVSGYLAAAADEACTLAAERKKWIAFTATVANAQALAALLTERGISAAVVCGDTPKPERERLIADFRAGRLRCLVTVLALATGFDVPDVDCILWLRPTQSPVLYVQGAGRGLRTAEGKRDCLWLDFSDTTERMGPLDTIKGRKRQKRSPREAVAPTKVCVECGERMPTASTLCPSCGASQPEREGPEARSASNAAILSTQAEPKLKTYPVSHVGYYRHPGKDGKPDSLRVDYHSGLRKVCSEWVCLEHGGFAGAKAAQWWRQRTHGDHVTVPATVQDALAWAHAGGLLEPAAIIVNESGQWPELVKHLWELPEHEPSRTESHRAGAEAAASDL